ncbi:MAG: hypothetical protein ACJAS3_002638 [Roseivirga sp.]
MSNKEYIKKSRMKRFAILTAISSLVFSCDSENPGEITREYFDNSELVYATSQPFQDDTEIRSGYIQDGEHITFRYSYFHPQDDDISDDELAEIFIFEIPKNSTEFNYSTSENIANDFLKADYQRSCFCGPVNFELVSASISARKIGGAEWEVSFDILYKDQFGEYPLKDAGKYRQGSL